MANGFKGCTSCGGNKVASRPELFFPQERANLGKFLFETATGDGFCRVDKTAQVCVRSSRKEEMKVVSVAVGLKDLNRKRGSELFDDVKTTTTNLIGECRATVSHDEHHMKKEAMNAVRCVCIVHGHQSKESLRESQASLLTKGEAKEAGHSSRHQIRAGRAIDLDGGFLASL
jgi:hypothetical protein